MRRQYEVACLGFVFDLPTVAGCVASSHQGWAATVWRGVVMGDMCRCRTDASNTFQFVEGFFVLVTFGIAGFTLPTPKLWLVGRCRDRPSRALPLTCPNVKNFFFFKKKQKIKERKKRPQRGVHPRRIKKMFVLGKGTRNLAAIEVPK